MRDFMITSSILIAVVLLIRCFSKGRLNPVLQYALWLPVMIRLMIPIPLWSSSFSVLNLMPGQAAGIQISEDSGKTAEAEGMSGTGSMADADRNAGGDGKGTEIQGNTGMQTGDGTAYHAGNKAEAGFLDNGEDAPDTESSGRKIFFGRDGVMPDLTDSAGRSEFLSFLSKIWPYIWAAGAMLTGGYMLFYQLKWRRYLSANRKLFNGGKKYRDRLTVYTVRKLPSPCLSGRCIYLTEELTGDVRQLEHILAHEYCHYRHLDSIWVIVRCVLTTVYWFHPLVWAAARVSKQDSELACDAAAIRLLGEQERFAYGKTLLQLIIKEDCGRIGAASTMSGGEKGIRERITRIAAARGYMAATAGVVLLFTAAAVAVTFSGTKKEAEAKGAKEQVQTMEGTAEPAMEGKTEPAEETEEVRRNAEQELQFLEEEKFLQQPETLKNQEEELQDLQQAMVVEVEKDAVLKKLASYDAMVEETGSRAGVYAVRDACNLSDYVQAYYDKGDAAMKEGMYLLEILKGPDSSDIKVYGMYSKEYGCRGIKVLTGEGAENFDEAWAVSNLHGREENLRLYESAEDGMPRTFACKMIAAESSDTEVWNLYLCDRQDTGTMTLCTLRPAEIMEEITKRLRFEIDAEECMIVVYDREKPIGQIPVNASREAMKNVQGVVLDSSSISWELGNGEDEIRMITAVGLKLRGTEQNGTEPVWYHGLPLLSFPVTCGSFGEREMRLGQASVDTKYVNGRIQGADTLDQYLASTEVFAAMQERGTEPRQEVPAAQENGAAAGSKAPQ